MEKNVGFIGLGNIGRPMAVNLVNSQFTAHVYDINPAACGALAEYGAVVAASPAEMAKQCRIIGLCVRDDQDAKAVILGEQGLLKTSQPGTIIIIHSTVQRATIFELAELAADKGVHVLDVPITGGVQGAVNKTLCYLCGGPTDIVEQCKPVFQASASSIIYAGALGSGMALKLCNNLMTWASFLAIHEGLKLAEASGLGLDKLKEVSETNGVLTQQMLTFIEGRQQVQSELSSEASSRQSVYADYVGLAEKDLQAALTLADQTGVELPGVRSHLPLMKQVLLA